MKSPKRTTNSIGRRDFLKAAGVTSGALLLGACAPSTPAVPATTAVKATDVPATSIASQPTEASAPAVAPVEPRAAGRALPDDAAAIDSQVFRLPTTDNRFVCTGIGGYTVMYEVAGNFFEKLVKYNNDWDLENQIANSIETSPDGKVIKYKLEPGLTWDDDTPLTAEDFVTHFRVQMDPKNPSPVAWFWYPLLNAEAIHKGQKPVEELGIRAVDATTVEMTLRERTPYWNHLMAYMDSQPYAKHMWEKYGTNMYSSAESSRMSGYWRMAEWSKGKQVVMEARDNYHGKFPGYLKRIEIPFADPATLWAAYQNNEIDIIQSISSPGDVQAIRNDPQMSEQHYTWPEWRSWYLLFHSQDGPFKDVRVRKAFSHAIDRDAMCNGPLREFATPSYTIVPPGFPGTQAGDEQIKALQDFNPDAARKLLEEGGFAGGSDFPKLEMWLRGAAQGSTYMAAAEFIQAAIEEVLGIQLEIRPEESKTYTDAMGKYKIPITLINWGFDFPDPYDMLGVPFRSRFPAEGGRTDWKNDEFDKLIDAGSSFDDMTARYDNFKKAERVLLEDVGAVALWNPIIHEVWKPWVKGLTANSAGNTQYTFKKPMMHEIYISRH